MNADVYQVEENAMTLGAFIKLFFKKWYLTLALPCLVALAAYGVALYLPHPYQAVSSIEVANNWSTVNVLADQVIKEQSTSKVLMTRMSFAYPKTIYFQATGKPKKECIEKANMTLEELKDRINKEAPDTKIVTSVGAEKASKVDLAPEKQRVAVLAFFTALAIAMAIVLLAPLRKRGKGALSRNTALMPAEGAESDNQEECSEEKNEALASFAGKRKVAAVVILLYVFSVLCVLGSNSLYSIIEPIGQVLTVAIVVCILLIAVVCWRSSPGKRAFLRGWAIWLVLITVVQTTVALQNWQLGLVAHDWFMLQIAIAPLMIHFVRHTVGMKWLYSSFVNVVAFLAATSVILWLLGPIGHLIESNCSIEYRWYAIVKNEFPEIPGYFYLLFQSQHLNIDGFGELWRNTGIYPESPMYTYALVTASCFELYLVEKPRILIVAFLACCILSTVSTTGIILLVVMLLFYVALKLSGKQLFIVVPLVIIGIAITAYAAHGKLVNWSGMVHLDDFSACIQAWLNDPLFGNGFDWEISIQSYMSDFRLWNPGLSNSLGFTLAAGGVLFLALHIVAFAGFFIRGSSRLKLAGIVLLILWAVTIAPRLPITMLILAIGAERTIDEFAIKHFDRPSHNKEPFESASV